MNWRNNNTEVACTTADGFQVFRDLTVSPLTGHHRFHITNARGEQHKANTHTLAEAIELIEAWKADNK